MRLEAMAVEIPHVDKHPNRVPFEGVLTVVNAASDKAPRKMRWLRSSAWRWITGPAGMGTMRGARSDC
ncbi:MAG: hypothetical protein ABSA42_05435 [Terracidiphilus sp.]